MPEFEVPKLAEVVIEFKNTILIHVNVNHCNYHNNNPTVSSQMSMYFTGISRNFFVPDSSYYCRCFRVSMRKRSCPEDFSQFRVQMVSDSIAFGCFRMHSERMKNPKCFNYTFSVSGYISGRHYFGTIMCRVCHAARDRKKLDELNAK